MNKIHIAIGVSDIARSVDDYSKIFIDNQGESGKNTENVVSFPNSLFTSTFPL